MSNFDNKNQRQLEMTQTSVGFNNITENDAF